MEKKEKEKIKEDKNINNSLCKDGVCKPVYDNISTKKEVDKNIMIDILNINKK